MKRADFDMFARDIMLSLGKRVEEENKRARLVQDEFHAGLRDMRRARLGLPEEKR